MLIGLLTAGLGLCIACCLWLLRQRQQLKGDIAEYRRIGNLKNKQILKLQHQVKNLQG